jgi:hypothetical protein
MDLASRTDPVDEGGVLSMAFHPGLRPMASFVYYTLRTETGAGNGVHDRTRFSVATSDRDHALTESEVPLISQFRRGSVHHGGDMDFGPDGYLYVSLGDESGGGDTWNNGQMIDRNFFSAILRIDVDQRPGSLRPNPHPAVSINYAIPPDNPYVGATSFNSRPVDEESSHRILGGWFSQSVADVLRCRKGPSLLR